MRDVWRRRIALADACAGVARWQSLRRRAATVLGPWVPLFDGIDHAVGTNTSGGGGMPDLMVMYALRVDLTDTNIQFYASPRIAVRLLGGRPRNCRLHHLEFPDHARAASGHQRKLLP